MTHFLDTSALCCHLFRHPGWQEVEDCLLGNAGEVGVSAISWFELRYVLKRLKFTDREAYEVVDRYRASRLVAFPVDESVAIRAFQIRDALGGRLPLADALIAASAAESRAVLLHCDSHFDALPARIVRQRRLEHPPADASSSDVLPAVREPSPKYPVRRTRRTRVRAG